MVHERVVDLVFSVSFYSLTCRLVWIFIFWFFSCVRKNLIPAQASEASGGRMEGGVRGPGSPRPAG